MRTWTAALLVALPGCVVTNDVQFEPPANFPPSIASAPAADHPIGELVLLTGVTAGGGDAGGAPDVRFDVVVLDPDVSQTLQYKVYLDYDPMAFPPTGPVVSESLAPMTSGDRTRRAVSFIIPSNRLLPEQQNGCHRVELLVSSRFQSDRRDPVEPGDVAIATWIVGSRINEDDDVALFDDCR